ncbi:MAG: class I SAM-dependent methyltransferase [Acidimicrobiales bacterium]|nr:class I SAM-dependent methyltransferase [Acidimicrobiales bacterium]
MAGRKQPNWYTERHLIEPLLDALDGTDGWIADLGCGPGALTAPIADRFNGRVVGIDGSPPRLERARAAHPEIEFHLADFHEPLPSELQGRFDVAVSTEVIEHLLLPRALFRAARDTGADRLVLTTPYHGYWKNLALAVTGKFDEHWEVHKDYGHVKFFSVDTITKMADEEGWRVETVRRLGRIAPLAMSMLIDFRR